MDRGSRDSLSWEETRNWPPKMQGFGVGDEDRAKLILERGRRYELEVNCLIYFFIFYEVNNLIFCLIPA